MPKGNWGSCVSAYVGKVIPQIFPSVLQKYIFGNCPRLPLYVSLKQKIFFPHSFLNTGKCIFLFMVITQNYIYGRWVFGWKNMDSLFMHLFTIQFSRHCHTARGKIISREAFSHRPLGVVWTVLLLPVLFSLYTLLDKYARGLRAVAMSFGAVQVSRTMRTGIKY